MVKARKVYTPGSRPAESPSGSMKKKGRGCPRKEGNRKKKRPYKKLHDQEKVKQAALRIKAGMSLRVAAEKFGIPRSTLSDKVKNQHSESVGRPTALTMDEENMLVERLLLISEWGYPPTSRDLRYIVRSYLESIGKSISR